MAEKSSLKIILLHSLSNIPKSPLKGLNTENTYQ